MPQWTYLDEKFKSRLIGYYLKYMYKVHIERAINQLYFDAMDINIYPN